MNSFVVDKKNIVENNEIFIDDVADFNHLKNVLRLKEGDMVRIVDGEFEYIAKIILISKKEARLKIEERSGDRYSLDIEIDAAISVIKHDKMELVIQKLTEIGVNSIAPVETKRTVIKLDSKKDKWDRISKEALKQCRGVKLVEIQDVKKLKELKFSQYDIVFVPYENEDKKTIAQALNELKSANKTYKKILYIIGPEGGFDNDEIEFLLSNGCVPVSLGKRILRAETAAIVMGGILANEF